MCLVIIKSLFKITIADGFYALLFIIFFLNISLNKYIVKILQMVGRYSMPMWMTHTFFCAYLFPDFIYGFKYPILIFIVLVTVSYLTAIGDGSAVLPFMRFFLYHGVLIKYRGENMEEILPEIVGVILRLYRFIHSIPNSHVSGFFLKQI